MNNVHDDVFRAASALETRSVECRFTGSQGYMIIERCGVTTMQPHDFANKVKSLFAQYEMESDWQLVTHGYAMLFKEGNKRIHAVYLPYTELDANYHKDVQRSGESFFSFSVYEE